MPRMGPARWILLLTAMIFAPFASGKAPPQSLMEALDALRRAGLNVVYSSALIPPNALSAEDSGSGTPQERAARLLEPHGLGLQEVSAGYFVVVRLASPEAKEAAPNVELSELAGLTIHASRYRIDQQPSLSVTQATSETLDTLPGASQDALRACDPRAVTGQA